MTGIELPWNGWDNWWSYAGEAQVLRALLAAALLLFLLGCCIIPTVESTSFPARVKTAIAGSVMALFTFVFGWRLWKRHGPQPKRSQDKKKDDSDETQA